MILLLICTLFERYAIFNPNFHNRKFVVRIVSFCGHVLRSPFGGIPLPDGPYGAHSMSSYGALEQILLHVTSTVCSSALLEPLVGQALTGSAPCYKLTTAFLSTDGIKRDIPILRLKNWFSHDLYLLLFDSWGSVGGLLTKQPSSFCQAWCKWTSNGKARLEVMFRDIFGRYSGRF